jgi:hypothetical protein
VSGPSPQRLWKYATQRLRLASYFQVPGDGRSAPQISARAVVWGLVIGHVLREDAFAGVDALVRGGARALAVGRRFSHDTLAYVTARLDPAPTRQALGTVARQAKRNKALAGQPWIGLALDGTMTACVQQAKPDCAYCRPLHNAAGEVLGYRHHVTVVSVAGVGVTLPVDAEPYGPGDSEYGAGQRVIQRVVGQLGPRFADYVVADGEFATAPFLHTVGELGLHFDPWDTLRWTTVRVLRYRQTKPDGRVIEALWLSDWRMSEVSSRALYRMAKSRWEIENETFNVAKTYHGMEHICHHQGNSLLVNWLLLLLALAIERLYRLRYLHRGTHPVLAAIDLVRTFRRSLGRPLTGDTS